MSPDRLCQRAREIEFGIARGPSICVKDGVLRYAEAGGSSEALALFGDEMSDVQLSLCMGAHP